MSNRGKFLVLLLCACGPAEPAEPAGDPALPHWTFSPEMIFPADRSLVRPEDGVALDDGRLIVADQVHGLRLVEPDGSSRPFGRFAAAGYRHDPPARAGGPNGVSLEPDGAHVLVSDVFQGGLYRVEIATEATERIYQHPYGTNTARRDRNGGIWFTQSTRNNPENGEEELFESVAVPVADGALFYLPPAQADEPPSARPLVEDLVFANGIALDETSGILYVAETMASRVLRFRVDTTTGQVADRQVALEVDHPDNLELDAAGRLWIAGPIRSELVVFDPATSTAESVFRISTPESEELIARIDPRLEQGEPWLDLLIPGLWEPAPGLITGLILTTEDGPIYLTGLGDALIRLER